MDYTNLFYWLVVADNAKTFFGFFASFFCIVFIVTQIVRVFALLENGYDVSLKTLKAINTWTWYSTPFMILFLALWIFTPTKKDSLLIVAGGGALNYLSQDSTAKQIPKQMTNFIVTELQTMAKENQVELGLQSIKQKTIDEAKEMTTEELLHKLKTDSTFSKTILTN